METIIGILLIIFLAVFSIFSLIVNDRGGSDE
jgi:hypothetical protein